MFGVLKYASGVQQLVEFTPISGHPDAGLPGAPGHPDAGLPGWERPTDPGYGQGHPLPDRPGHDLPWAPARPGHGLPGSPGHPGNALPVPPVRPSNPITLPPGVWPPMLPPTPGIDNELPTPPPGVARPPIYIPPDPSIGIENPIVLPELPAGVALLIALPQATPKAGDPPNTKPAILVQSGKKPVLVYVSAAASPK
jgi:hypothetical protein